MRKLVLCLGVIFGVFIALGSVSEASASTADKSASPADQLQPASDITYNENLTVNGTGRFDSVYIGKQGVGGVTFFNGTIVNSTTNDGVDNPVTFGDNVRIDGRVFRGENYGPGLGDDMAFIINDDAQVTGDLTVNGGLLGSEIITPVNLAVNTTPSDGYVLSYDDGNFAWISRGNITSSMINDGTITGDDISSSANLSVATGTFSGNITVHGDVVQDLTDHGVVKALIFIDGDSDGCYRSWTYNEGASSVTCDYQDSLGYHQITLPFDVSNRYWETSNVSSSEGFVRARLVDGDSTGVLRVFASDAAGLAANRDSMLIIY